MKQLIVILGVVLLSSTDAFAADMNLKDGIRHTFETLPGYFPSEVTSLNTGGSSNPFALEGSSNSLNLRKQHLVEAGYDQEQRGGPPGDRNPKGG